MFISKSKSKKVRIHAYLIIKIPKGKWNFYSINKDILKLILTKEAINKLITQKKLSKSS